MRRLAFLIALLPIAAQAASTDQQLLRNVERGLREYRIDADVSQLTLSQAAAIYLIVTSPDEDDGINFGNRTRQDILSILRWNEATDPDRK